MANAERDAFLPKAAWTEIFETNDFGARRVGLCQASRPRPWLRRWRAVDKVRCHTGRAEFVGRLLGQPRFI